MQTPEDKAFYTEDTSARRGWALLREYSGYRNVESLDDLRPGVIYQGPGWHHLWIDFATFGWARRHCTVFEVEVQHGTAIRCTSSQAVLYSQMMCKYSRQTLECVNID
jgi:hypothetical protein